MVLTKQCNRYIIRIMTYLQVRLEPAIKSEAERVFDQLGLTMSQAVKLFFKQVIMRKSIPFPIVITKEKRTYVSPAEELMIEESLREISQGKTTQVDMSDERQVKKYFGV